MTDSAILNVVFQQSLQILLFAAVVFLITITIARRRPKLAYALWMLVFLKAVIPPIGAGFSVWNLLPESLASTPPAVAGASTTQPASTDSAAERDSRNPAATTTDQPAAVNPATAVGFSLPMLLLSFWGFGVAALSFAAVRASRRMGRLIRDSSGGPDLRLRTAVRDLSGELRISRMTDSIVLDEPIGPALRGFFKPQLLIPRRVIAACNDEQLRLIVLHELMHVRRNDVLAGYFQTIVQILWWFHPAIWFAGRAATLERERCCDDEVLNVSSSDREAYAQCLLDTARSSAKQTWAPCVVGLSGVKAIRQRMRHIMDDARRKTPTWLVVGIAAVIAMLILPGAIQPNGELDERFSNGPLLPEGISRLPIAEPKILAMTWQRGENGSGKHSDVPMWNADGEQLTDEAAAAIRAEIRGTETNWWDANEESRPLVFVIDPGTQLKEGTTGVQVISWSNGKKLAELGSWMNRLPGQVSAERMFTVSSSISSMPRFGIPGKWVESIDVELKFPIEEPQLIQTLTEIPTEPVTVAGGITWQVDPLAGYDPAVSRAGGRPIRFPAAVLKSIRNESTDLVIHSVNVYSKDSDEPLSGSHATLEGDPRSGPIFDVRVSRRFPTAEQFDRIEIYRQRFARSLIKNVRVRTDLMP